jgi:hypothetical protein
VARHRFVFEAARRRPIKLRAKPASYKILGLCLFYLLPRRAGAKKSGVVPPHSQSPAVAALKRRPSADGLYLDAVLCSS